MKVYDALVIGGGPAGLSAAIYLARFNRSCLVIDAAQGRWQSREINENYFGFPGGIEARTLVHRGREQAESFGVEFLIDSVVSVEQLPAEEAPPTESYLQTLFRAKLATNETVLGRTVLLATGVTDHFPEIININDCLGRSLFWCITCDGWKARDKTVAVLGRDDESVVTCLQFLEFTKKLLFVTHLEPGTHEISPAKVALLKKYQIPFYDSRIREITSADGWLDTIILADGQRVAADLLFSETGCSPHSELGVMVGVKVNEAGYIFTGDEQRTNVPGVYAAGDVTRRFAHQIVTAAHEGSMAAQAINYDLYSLDQRH